jgi:hypothetical protein
MSQLHFYVPEDVEKQLRQRADQANQPLSRFLAELVKREADQPAQWPEGYFEQVFGKWEGGPLRREPQGDFEARSELD